MLCLVVRSGYITNDTVLLQIFLSGFSGSA